MALETWIDDLAAVWDEVSNGRGGYVRSYRLFTKREFPEALTQYPCVVTYPQQMSSRYMTGAQIELWQGISELHACAGVSKADLADVLRYFGRIRAAAASHVTLGGKVSYFQLEQEGDNPSIEGPSKLQYGNEEPHWGLLVHWVVKESISQVIGG
jgi:hypothetical protein